MAPIRNEQIMSDTNTKKLTDNPANSERSKDSRDPACYALLQPSDSERVADAIIATLDGADFDVALECGKVIREELSRGFTVGLGCAIADSVERAVTDNFRA